MLQAEEEGITVPSIQDDRGYNQGYKRSLSVEVRTERRCDYMISKMDLSRDVRILEIGCGTGRLSYLLAKKTGKQVLGTDICGPFIENAKNSYSLPNLDYELLDFSRHEHIEKVLKNRTFDYIVGDGILHHLYPFMDRSLEEAWKLLNNGGKMVFLEPNFYNPYCLLIFNITFFRKLAKLEPGEMSLKRKFITEKLSKAGFTGINVEYSDYLVPGIPDFMIKPSIAAGSLLEKIPFVNMTAQSLYITASKAGAPAEDKGA